MQEKRPLFIVGTAQEVAHIEAEGHEAQTVQGMDAAQLADFALKLATDGRTAIVILNDDATAQLAEACAQAGAAYRVAGAKSIDRLVSLFTEDKTEFAAFLDREESAAIEQAKADRAEAQRRQLEKLGVHDVFNVALEISSGEADRKRIPTGLKTLDEALDGGLTEGGLTTLGATSSTGKTSLALQIADGMAESGRAVLFVTVEQGRHELVAKSISRLIRLEPTNNGGYFVASGADILCAEKRNLWCGNTKCVFNTACADYTARISPNMYIMELDKQPTTKQIRKAAKAIQAQRGEPPCVFVDYLQLLAPANDRMTERQAVDHNVMDLRHLARDLKTCVVVISSLNRASYSEGVNMAGMKESGSIEYSSDILLGMQPRGLEEKLSDVADSKRKREARQVERDFRGKGIREAEIKVLKNRGGATPKEPIPLTFEAACSLFTCPSWDTAHGPSNKDGKPVLRL